MPQYRYLAKERLAKATSLLETGNEDDLTYACLELRKCLEALSYETLTGYLSEVPLKAFEAWQPDKVMKEMLRIDPSADRSSHIRMREESRDGRPDGKIMNVGEDRRLTAQRTTKAYQQLGSFLHVPTIKQEREGTAVDSAIVRERAEAIRDELAHVLGSNIWNANFSVSVTINCTECEAPIKRRVSVLENGQPIECGNCGQLFEVIPQPDETFFFPTVHYDWNCESCQEKNSLVQSKVRDGAEVACKKCDHRAILKSSLEWHVIAKGKPQTEASAKPTAA
jgi:predicted nucleic acid-binding Zn ribbon protein